MHPSTAIRACFWTCIFASALFFLAISRVDLGLACVMSLQDSAESVLLREAGTVSSKELYFNPFLEHFVAFQQHSVLPKRFCPCCGWSGDEPFEGRTFSGVGAVQADRACPVCGAYERHRKACAFLGCNSSVSVHRHPGDGPFRLLHFGPEPTMMKMLNKFRPGLDQIGLDYFADGYEQKYDMTKTFHGDAADINLPSRFADGIIILHVLEHVRKLDDAVAELKRVLAPSGWLLLEVPCSNKFIKTENCTMFEAPKDLVQCAGQRDHVWKFNCDEFIKGFLNVGFVCSTWNDLKDHDSCYNNEVQKAILPRGGGSSAFLCHIERK